MRTVLTDAIKALKEPEDIEEPTERASREALHLDHDRQGVPGSPDLAPTIFAKIAAAAVFIADVTLVGSVDRPEDEKGPGGAKRLVNSNVAIEYGYALRSLGDIAILMVQNTYYGNREALPFDLKHKAGPIQYHLAPNATKDNVAKEAGKLRSQFIAALRPYLGRTQATGVPERMFRETPPTTNIATFWQPADVLATVGSVLSRVRGPRDDDDPPIEYRFHEQHVFYLRLIPVRELAEPLAVTALMEVVERRGLQVLTRTINGGMAGRNKFGAISYEPHGTSATPIAFSQLFRNGEIWGVTREFAAKYEGELVVPMVNVLNIYNRVLANFVKVASEDLGIPYSYQAELGAVGLDGMCVSLPSPAISNQLSDHVYEGQLKLRKILNRRPQSPRIPIVDEFIAQLYDLAGVVPPTSAAG